jgi:hypothetical protein
VPLLGRFVRNPDGGEICAVQYSGRTLLRAGTPAETVAKLLGGLT